MRWERREKQLLQSIAQYEAQGERPRDSELIETTGLDPQQVEFALRALYDGGYIDGIDATSMDGFGMLAIELRPRGREALGQWPDSSTGSTQTQVDIRLFISHSSADTELAKALIDLLRIATELPAGDIRCTSVNGYRLPAGARTKEQLRREILGTETFLGLISESSLNSAFVLFELGARWGAKKHLAPLTVRGVNPGDLTGPLGDLNALDGRDSGQVDQLVSDIAKELRLTVAKRETFGHLIDQVVSRAKGA